jgi:CRP-like cAMP-binding protein
MTSASNDVSIDHALTLFLANQPEEALRWAGGIVERAPQSPTALVIVSRMLHEMGRTRAATGGLCLAFRRAVAQGDLPIAMAAVDALRELGMDVDQILRSAAATFCLGSPRIDPGAKTPPPVEELQPLSPFLAGPALASRTTDILKDAHEAKDEAGPAHVPAMPVFGSLPLEALAALLKAFRVITVPAGYVLLEEGSRASALHVLARGQVEVRRRAAHGQLSVPVCRLEEGAFLGETALLGDVPSSYSVVATRPCMIMTADAQALEAVALRYPSVATELEIRCRRNLVANLGRSADVLLAIPAARRAEIIDAFDVRVFAQGEKIIAEGADVDGLYVIASGEVTVSARDGAETVILATLVAGDTLGDVEVVLCRKAGVDAIATTRAAALFLPRSYFERLVQSDPATAHGLYLNAVRKATITAQALESPTSSLDAPDAGAEITLQDPMKEDVAPFFRSVAKPLSRPSATPPPLPASARTPSPPAAEASALPVSRTLPIAAPPTPPVPQAFTSPVAQPPALPARQTPPPPPAQPFTARTTQPLAAPVAQAHMPGVASPLAATSPAPLLPPQSPSHEPERASRAPSSRPPSSLAPTMSSSKPPPPVPRAPSSAPIPPRRSGPSVLAASVVSLGIGIGLTILVPRLAPTGAAAGSVAPAARPMSDLDSITNVVSVAPQAPPGPSAGPDALALSSPSATPGQQPRVASAAKPKASSEVPSAPAPRTASPPASPRRSAASDDEFGERQ